MHFRNCCCWRRHDGCQAQNPTKPEDTSHTFRRGRADRHAGAQPRAGDGQVAQAGVIRERRRRRRDDRRGARGQGRPDGYTVRCPHRHVDRALALPHAQLRSAQGLRVHRRGGRRAVTLIARGDFRNQHKEFSRTSRRTRTSSAGANAAWARPHLCGLLFMTAIQTDLVTVPYRAGSGRRPARWPSRFDVRPDHEHHRPDQRRQVKVYGVTSKKRVSPAQHPDARRAGAEGLRGGGGTACTCPRGLSRCWIGQRGAAGRGQDAESRRARGWARAGERRSPTGRRCTSCSPRRSPGGADHRRRQYAD